MTSKLTTYCGAVTIIASGIAAYNFTPLTTKIASCVATVATGLGLYFARDNKVSDEQAGAGKTDANPSVIPNSSISADLNTAGSIKNSAPVAPVVQPVAESKQENKV